MTNEYTRAQRPTQTPAPRAEAFAEAAIFSEESERLAVAVMLNPNREKLHNQLFELLADTDFHVEQHQAIWRIIAMLRNAGLPFDISAINDAGRKQDEFLGGAVYLTQLLDEPIARAASNQAVEAAAGRIKEFSLLRRLQGSLRQALALCSGGQGFSQVASFVEDDVQNLLRSSKTSRTGPQPMSNFCDAIMAKMQARLDGEEPEDKIPTGFEQLDDVTGALLPETLTVIAARPAMGKTAFLDSILQHVSVTLKRPSLLFSLEMTGVAVTTRSLARHSYIPMPKLKSGELEDYQWTQFTESIDALCQSPCYIDESPGLSLSEIRSRARAFLTEHPGAVIGIDYLQLITSDKPNADRQKHVSEVSSGLKLLARELRCPVIALSQLNRSLEQRANKRPMLSDLRESGQIEQDAEIIMFLYRDEVYNPDTPEKGITEAIVGKNRDGETKTVKMSFEGATMRFRELGTHSHE
jgi:replicative DNA helicase